MSVVFTIGYEGSDIDAFVATLKAVNIQVLADIRAVAGSRRPGFSKNSLRDRLAQAGIEYIHYKNLGDPKPGRDAARSGQFEKFRTIYNAHLQRSEAQEDFANLVEVVFNQATCLLCYERLPENCHRAIVAKRMGRFDLDVFDLFADDPSRYVRNSTKIPRHYPRQSTAAAE